MRFFSESLSLWLHSKTENGRRRWRHTCELSCRKYIDIVMVEMRALHSMHFKSTWNKLFLPYFVEHWLENAQSLLAPDWICHRTERLSHTIFLLLRRHKNLLNNNIPFFPLQISKWNHPLSQLSRKLPVYLTKKHTVDHRSPSLHWLQHQLSSYISWVWCCVYDPFN